MSEFGGIESRSLYSATESRLLPFMFTYRMIVSISFMVCRKLHLFPPTQSYCLTIYISDYITSCTTLILLKEWGRPKGRVMQRRYILFTIYQGVISLLTVNTDTCNSIILQINGCGRSTVEILVISQETLA